MSADWRYTQDPSLSDRDKVRFLIGDTDPADRQLTDAEVDWLVTEEADYYKAAASACLTIAAQYARKVEKAVGDLKIKWGDRQQHYFDLADRLASRHAIRSGTVYAGGISKDDVATYDEDTDRVKPAFDKGMHDHKGVVTSDIRPIDEV